MERHVTRDQFGRKIKTTYYDDFGSLDYENVYFYRKDSDTKPFAGEQTYFRPGGTREKKISNVYDERTQSFRMIKEDRYDKDDKLFYSRNFDENGNVEKEKIFSYRNGFTFVHRKQFDNGHLIKEGNYVALAGQLIERTPVVDKIITEYNRRIEQTAKEETKTPIAMAYQATTSQR